MTSHVIPRRLRTSTRFLMDNGCRVGKPKEGLNTLVARFSFTHFDKAVEKIKLEFIGQQTMFIKDIGEK